LENQNFGVFFLNISFKELNKLKEKILQ
jgi:hypothetical protein